MDPSFYRSMTMFHRVDANQPVPDAMQGQQSGIIENSGDGPDQDTNWIVYGPDAMRGNLRAGEAKVPDSGPSMSVDRSSGSNDKQKALGDMGWMNSRDPQPLLWSMGDDEATPRASDQTSHYPYPDLSLPHPSLHLDFRMAVTLNPRISLGPTPFGHRNWISFTGGRWSGSWGSGIVLPGGQDSQLIIGDGSAHLETNYILQTYDDPPAHIVVRTHGWRTGPPEILAQLADPELADKVDPNSYKFRLFIDMETGDERYRDNVNCGMWVGSGMRKGAEVIYDAYRLS
ncbi:hypothetical protein VTL71DRAFT_15558 [Oculimacula yallundae]|uniref:Uncharacterized protein n=1 Tax=Oculimacula yallundae TaxID=86028 RepID=A0ABR4CHN6_9HELO